MSIKTGLKSSLVLKKKMSIGKNVIKILKNGIFRHKVMNLKEEKKRD